jgi:hypothetical protein
MTFKCKLSQAVLASERIAIDYQRIGVLIPVNDVVYQRGKMKISAGPRDFYLKPEQEIEVLGNGSAVVEDFNGVEHEIEFEARGSLVALREDHLLECAAGVDASRGGHSK